MSGLIGAGQYYRRSGNQVMQGLAQQEQQRNQTNEQIEVQDRASTLGMMGTGAAIGAQVGGPWGAAIGAGVGLIAGLAF